MLGSHSTGGIPHVRTRAAFSSLHVVGISNFQLVAILLAVPVAWFRSSFRILNSLHVSHFPLPCCEVIITITCWLSCAALYPSCTSVSFTLYIHYLTMTCQEFVLFITVYPREIILFPIVCSFHLLHSWPGSSARF